MSYRYGNKPVRSITAPDPSTASPYGLTETDLRKESARLEKMLQSAQLPGDLVKRLQQVRECMARFDKLKRDKTASSE